MMVLALFTLFALCALSSILVLADSGMRAAGAWHRLRGELRVLSGECGAALVRKDPPDGARVIRIGYRDVMSGGGRAAA